MIDDKAYGGLDVRALVSFLNLDHNIRSLCRRRC